MARQDESDDAQFYVLPRLVTHVDDATMTCLTEVYRELVPAGSRVLDLQSSWVSHLPDDVAYAGVTGHGMNDFELAQNPRLDARVVQNLNVTPELPFADASFDATLNAFSMQYLVRPVACCAPCDACWRPAGCTSSRCRTGCSRPRRSPCGPCSRWRTGRAGSGCTSGSREGGRSLWSWIVRRTGRIPCGWSWPGAWAEVPVACRGGWVPLPRGGRQSGVLSRGFRAGRGRWGRWPP